MKRIKISKNFNLDELVDPVTYFTDPDHGLSRIDPCIIDCLQLLRSLKGSSIGVNNWWGERSAFTNVDTFSKWVDQTRGVYQWSGFRSKKCKIGASKSKHKLGQAVDPKGNQHELFKIVEDNAKLFYALGLRRLEDTSITNGWLHMDVSETHHTSGKIRIVSRTSHTGDIII